MSKPSSSATPEPLTGQWSSGLLPDLSREELFHILYLRIEVFVKEWGIAFQEMDEYDIHPATVHVRYLENGELLAYARIIPPGVLDDSVHIGRVVVRKSARNRKLGKALIQRCLEIYREQWPNSPCVLDSVVTRMGFYKSLGFHPIDEPFIEESGEPHIRMQLDANRST
ncbi:ELLA family acetyltransferase [Schizosaccharomyces japonicus yFS275]|uniref:ELLA family acetyltransferase n=1 Tax=Schizosaccharomyces japonicus (strain yFS275 / FY16936) TaxID=402676 RepID=B6K7N4_SCHJY|nr:ELLA family acetyltransferase [Schizosaccharomyces japonicus yFS275]EEB09538.1 ELLA family acetyltransferase [Schizosaccharomyces japonicus yFS275]